MKLRTRCIPHFVPTISNGLVSKFQNIDCHKKPTNKLQSLEDMCENENAENMPRHSSNVLFEDKKVKCENADLPVEIDLDENTPLKHLRKQLLSRKRKLTCRNENSVKDNPNGNLEDDVSDLDEPLINLKRKSRKNVNRRSSGYSEIDNIGSQSKEKLVSELLLQVDDELTPVVSDRFEIPDIKISGFQSKNILADESYDCSTKFKYPCGIASDVQQQIAQNENCGSKILDLDSVDIEPICGCIPLEELSIMAEDFKDEQHQQVSKHGDPEHIIRKSNVANAKAEYHRRSSRTVPQIRVLSESVIRFSKKQMRDVESLVADLTNELKCMKNMVEQKLLFEAYRSPVIRNCVSEVKSAIIKAVKVEEKSKKQLSLITRDCDRFCERMKRTRSSAAASNDTAFRKRRKILFADEAGEKLCHVKFFDVGEPSSDMMYDT